MIKAVIFDFDGTLADTVPALCEGVNLTMEQYGYPTHTEEEVRSFINNGARMLIKRAMPAPLREDEELVSRVLADYDRLYGSVYLHTTELYPGMAELLRKLKEEGYLIGVLSNKQDEFVKNLCRRVLPEGCFQAAQGVVPGKPTKPDPYLAVLTAKNLGVSPEDCVEIGDSDVDIRTAKSAGMAHIGVTWGYRGEAFLKENGAVRIVHSPDEIPELLKRMKPEQSADRER